MKLLFFSDAHLRGNNPRSRKDNYILALENKFKQIGDIIQERNVDLVLNGGDLFNSPAPSYSITSQFASIMKAWRVPMYSIIGSHDKFGYNDDTLHRTALGILVSTGVTKILSEPVKIEEGVYICGTSHSYDLDTNPENYRIKRPEDCEFMVQIVHGMLVPNNYFGNYTLIKDLKTEADLVVCGHYHPGYETVEVSDATLVNIGSLGRNEKINRIYPPSVLIIDTQESKYEIIPLKVNEDVFLKIENTDLSVADDIETFMESLKDRIGHLEGYNVKELIIRIGQEENVRQEIINKALEYVE